MRKHLVLAAVVAAAFPNLARAQEESDSYLESLQRSVGTGQSEGAGEREYVGETAPQRVVQPADEEEEELPLPNASDETPRDFGGATFSGAAEGEVGHGVDGRLAREHTIEALNLGLLKVLSKMGISTIKSYTGAKIFEAVGLDREVIERYFPNTHASISGVGVEALAREALDRHARAFPREHGFSVRSDVERALLPVDHERILPQGGVYQWRRDGERHMWDPDTIANLQRAARNNGDARLHYSIFAERVNEEWLTYMRLGRSHVTWKFAATLDGRSAAEDGTSKWITSPEARADVHRMRAASDAIVAGIGTVLADDPRLTARPGGEKPARQPVRVVVDPDARTPASARVLDGEAPTLIAVADDVDTDLKADLLRLPRHDAGLDLHALLAELAARRLVSVFLEGGPALAGSFVKEGLVDRVVAYLAPALLGSGKAALGAAGAGTIGRLHRFTFDDVTAIGPDVRLIARPHRVPAGPQPGREQ